jgi:PAS domain S-box-containing protein
VTKQRKAAFTKLNRISKSILSELLIKNLPVNIFLVDKEGHVCWANERLLKIINIASLKEIEGVNISTWDNVRWEYIQEVINTKQETIHEECYEGYYFSTIRKPVFDENNEIIGVLGIAIDITDRKKAEIAKNQFLHNIRHDIRTPVSGIIGLVSILQESIDQPNLKVFMDSLVHTSESLLGLLDRVFESVQFSTGEIPISNHHFSLKKSLETVYKLHHAKALEKNLAFTFNYDPTIPTIVVGEALRVQRIVWELLTNALKYTETGSIELNARLLKQEETRILVEIQVKDTGLGIAADKHEMIFNKFTRLTPAWLGFAHGQGLGLFNVKQLIADLGATIHLESAPDEGASFTCHIPLRLPDIVSDPILL